MHGNVLFLLGNYLVELVHSTVVKVDVLLDVALVSVHDVFESVCHLVDQVVLLLEVIHWHQVLVKVFILLVEESAGLVYL